MTEQANQALEQTAKAEVDLDTIISKAMEEEPKEPSKEVAEEPPIDDQPASEPLPESGENAADEQPEPAPEIEAPKHWSEEDRQTFGALDGKARDLVLQLHKKTEAAHTRRSQELAEAKRQVEDITRTLEPYRADLQRAGLRDADIVTQGISALRWDQRLKNDPVNAAKELLQYYNVPLEQLTNEYIDPDISALHREIGQLKNIIHSEKAQRETEAKTTYDRQIDSFRTATDEGGNPKHPHFDELRTEMAALIEARAASTLEEAYTKALRTRDDLYTKDVQSRVDAELKKKEEARRLEVEKAKKAARNLTGSAPAKVAPKLNTLDDIIEHNMSKAGL